MQRVIAPTSSWCHRQIGEESWWIERNQKRNPVHLSASNRLRPVDLLPCLLPSEAPRKCGDALLQSHCHQNTSSNLASPIVSHSTLTPTCLYIIKVPWNGASWSTGTLDIGYSGISVCLAVLDFPIASSHEGFKD